jgi:tetratricopeptide (TPR) repeat protein
MLIRELNILAPYAEPDIIKAAKKTAEELLARWRKRDFWWLSETFYALGLAVLAAETEVDGETADQLLYATPFAVQGVARQETVLPILAALRPLGEKAPHRYVSLLAAASGLTLLDEGTTLYIYLALQQLEDRLLETERIWPLVETVRAYSNLVRKSPEHIKSRWKGAANMCRLYDEVRKRGAATTPGVGLSTQRLFDAVARADVLATALFSDELAQVVQRYCGLGDLIKEAEAVKSVLDGAATHLDELRKIMENDTDFAEWVTIHSPTGDARFVIENFRGWFTYELAHYKLSHALDEKVELDEKKLEEAAEEFEKAAEMHIKLKHWENYLTARGRALRTRVIAAKSWEELLERAEGFRELWREAEKHLEPAAVYLATAAFTLGEYLVHLATSGNKEEAVKLLKERRWLLNYRPEVSVNTRLMLRVLGVGEEAKLEEVMDVFKSLFLPEFRPALLMLAGHLQRDEAHKECDKLSNAQPPEAKRCDIIVAAAAGDRVAAEILRSVIEEEAPEARPLLGKTDGRTLVEVLAPGYSHTRLAFMLLAAVEGRSDAVRLHGLLGSAWFKNLVRRLFRAVYEKCGDLNSEGCRLALLKLYYYHY